MKKRLSICLALLAVAPGVLNAQLLRYAPSVSSSSGPVLSSLYVGAVAGGTLVHATYAPYTYVGTRTPHYARDNLTDVGAVFGNWYGGASGTDATTAGLATQTVTASVEYPAGTCTPLTFGGASSGTIVPGQTVASANATLTGSITATSVGQIVTDLLPITIPKGAQFWIREYTTQASGNAPFASTNPNEQYQNPSLGEATEAGTTSAITDKTASCATMASNVTYSRKPQAVIGHTRQPAICLVGDSRLRGYLEHYNSSRLGMGEEASWIEPTYGVINLAIDSGVAAVYATGSNIGNRAALLPYCSAVVWEIGAADVNTATYSRSETEAVLPTFQAYAGVAALNLKWYVQTWDVWSTSTDSWATVANQSTHDTIVHDHATGLVASTDVCPAGPGVTGGITCTEEVHNALLRTTGWPGALGSPTVIDMNQITEDGPYYGHVFQGFWPATGAASWYTADGLHLSANGYNILVSQIGHPGAPGPASTLFTR